MIELEKKIREKQKEIEKNQKELVKLMDEAAKQKIVQAIDEHVKPLLNGLSDKILISIDCEQGKVSVIMNPTTGGVDEQESLNPAEVTCDNVKEISTVSRKNESHKRSEKPEDLGLTPQSKISDYKPRPKGQFEKYWEKPIKEFVKEIQNEGGTKRQNEVCNELIELFPELQEKTVTDQGQLQTLEKISIEDYRNDSNAILTAFKNVKISNLRELVAFKSESNRGDIRTIKDERNRVNYHVEEIISEWEKLQTPITLPTTYDAAKGLVSNLKNAIIEYAETVQSRSNRFVGVPTEADKKLADILLKAYKDGYRDDKIINEIRETYDVKTRESVRNKRTEFVDKFFRGEKFLKNLVLHPDLVAMVKSVKGECLFKPKSHFENYTGSKEEDLFKEFEIDTVEIGGDYYIIPRYEKLIYKNVCSAIIEALQNILLPKEKDVVIQQIAKSPNLKDIDYDPIFVNNVLSNSSFVDELDDGLIQIKDKFLTNDNQKNIRIIYEAAPERIKVKEVKKRYKEKYGKEPSKTPRQDKNYKIFCKADQWYYGEPENV